MKNVITQLAEGMIPDAVPHVEKADELGEMGRAISTMANGYAAKAEFAGQLGEGCFTSAYEAQSEKDILGRALLNMREQLQKNEEENRRRNWSAEGLAGFNTTLRHVQNAEKLGATILSELVQYLGANQAAIFVKTEDEGETYLKMTACYAYGREKHLSKKIYPGEGLAGQVFLEGASLLLTEIPEDYVRITSGLGGARPGCLLIVPLKLNDAIEGVLEIASFRRFEEHEISFIEKLAEHIAASLQHIRINRQTEALLQESRLKTDELQAKEEEMRQNMEELTATQEEMRRKEQTYLSRIAELENRPDGVHP
jgi:transcriptional regulator with GAF, ATPase, and Fis domain